MLVWLADTGSIIAARQTIAVDPADVTTVPRPVSADGGRHCRVHISPSRLLDEYGVVVDLLRDGFSCFAPRVPTYRSVEQLAAHERDLLERDGWRDLEA